MAKITFKNPSTGASVTVADAATVNMSAASEVTVAKTNSPDTFNLNTITDIVVNGVKLGNNVVVTIDSVVTPPPPTGFVPKFPGDVPAGKIRWGCSITGNGDPSRHEVPANHRLGLRRRYVSNWSNRMDAVKFAKEDLALGRLPWVSVKPASWADMAAGLKDAEIDALLNGLAGVGGPVWLSIHHEPEGGGGTNAPDDPAGASAWVAMQKKVRMRMTALGVKNVALVSVLMAYTFTSGSGRNPASWWADGVFDVAGIDYYVDSENPSDVATANAGWMNARKFYSGKVPIAAGEWGNRGTDDKAASEMKAFYEKAIASSSDNQGARVVGLSYFDSGLNSSTGGWELAGKPLEMFRALMNDPRSLLVGEK